MSAREGCDVNTNLPQGVWVLKTHSNVLDAETALRRGKVPESLQRAELETPTFAISKTAFLLRLRSGLAFHYRRGDGVVFECPDRVTDAEVTLFFNGSVFGAIAWLNGFVPLHASAIVDNGRVHAFTGASGSGKSTLAAALGVRGFSLMSDDILVLDVTGPDQINCLPSHNLMKLWDDALSLTDVAAESRVRPQLEKFYVSPPGGTVTEPMPLSAQSFRRCHLHHQKSIGRRCLYGLPRRS